MNFMIVLNLIFYLMQVVQVEDKAELILLGGNIIAYQVIINILKMKIMVVIHQQIFVQLQWIILVRI